MKSSYLEFLTYIPAWWRIALAPLGMFEIVWNVTKGYWSHQSVKDFGYQWIWRYHHNVYRYILQDASENNLCDIVEFGPWGPYFQSISTGADAWVYGNIERRNQPQSSKILPTPCAQVFGDPKLPPFLNGSKHHFELLAQVSVCCLFQQFSCYRSKKRQVERCRRKNGSQKNGGCLGRWEWCGCCFVKRDSNRISKVIYNQGRSGW